MPDKRNTISLAGKVAVLTGSTRGLGRAIAETYAAAGAAVMVSSRTPAAVEQTVAALQAAGFQAAGQPCDVGDAIQVRALADRTIEAFGRFDIWVNNAGLAGPYGPTMHLPPEEFVRVVQTNILGVYYGSLAAMQHFLQRGEGKLINVLGRGDRQPAPMQNAYGASKAWVRNFTLALAREYKKSGVGVYAFSPGLVDTDLLRQVTVIAGYEDRIKALETVMRLWAERPETPAGKALWLASSATDGRTGLQVRTLKLPGLVAGLAREGWRRLIGRPAEPIELTITAIPAARGEKQATL